MVLFSLFPIYTSLERAETHKAIYTIQNHSQNALHEFESENERLFFTALNLYMDRNLKDLYYSSVSSNENIAFYNMTLLQEQAKLYFQNIDNIVNFVLYLPKLNYVITPDYLFQDRQDFYNFEQYNMSPNSDWLQSALSPESSLVAKQGTFTNFVTETSHPVINLFFTFPIAGHSNIPLLIMVSLDAQAIAETFLPENLSGQVQCIVTQTNGEYLVSTNLIAPDSQELADNYHAIHIEGKSNLESTVYIHNNFYHKIQVDSLKLILRSMGIALFLGVCASLYFAWSRSRPLENVLNIIRRSGSSKEPRLNLEDIENSVVDMVSEIRICKDTIKNLDYKVSHNLLERLFFGEFSSVKMRDAFIQYFGVFPSSCICAVFAGADRKLNGMDLKEVLTNSLSAEEVPYYLIHSHEDKVYLLLQENDTVSEQLEHILKGFREHYQAVVKAGISNPFTSLEAVNKAAFRAEARLKAGFHIQGVYIFLHTYSSPASHNSLNIQLLDALQRALLSGNQHAGDKIIHEIFENLQSQKPDAVELRQIFFSLRSVYSAVINQFSLESERKGGVVQDSIYLPNDLEEYSQDSIITTYLALNSSIYEYYTLQLERNKKKKSASILSYIEENFRDPNLCASMIASHYNLSEKYIYQLVKDACGETLNDKIAALRIQEAIRYLENTNQTVSDIALSCGFISSNSMYKSFMRVKGVAPSTYRKTKGM